MVSRALAIDSFVDFFIFGRGQLHRQENRVDARSNAHELDNIIVR